MTYGTCKLTTQTGKLVKSHLLPKAVTRPPDPSVPRLDGTNGGRPVRRFDSWYDSSIVTRYGEDILSSYDDWAIKELRGLGLLWDGQAEDKCVAVYDQFHERAGNMVREVEFSDPALLRLFFLSLLWRAAVTNLPGYRIDIPDQDVERLRQMIVSRSATPLTFYPVVLIQLTTVGPWHNTGPMRKKLPISEDSDEGYNFIRFYFDGLIAHVYEGDAEELSLKVGRAAIGANEKTVILGKNFEDSYQDRWLKELIMYHYMKHHELSQKILGLKT